VSKAASDGTGAGSSILVAKVVDASGLPVGDAAVTFSIINATGGGETLSPVVASTASVASGGLGLGEARTTFTAGTSPSGGGGVRIRANVLGTAVATNTAPSGSDASIVIGGSAGSIVFSQATVLGSLPGGLYTLQMSVLVADSNGSPAPAGTVVNLSLWPLAWSTGGGCVLDADDGVDKGTFLNEDLNENLTLDPGEDGTRTYYVGGTAASTPGSTDGLITPVNSSAGTIPATVTTDANGAASFTLVYPNSSAIHTVVRVRGKTVVQGSESVSEYIFRLAPLLSDTTPICRLINPYIY
jgi:hypothetical protein